MDKFHTFLLFFLYSFSKHPQDETKTVVVVSSSKDDARMITTTWRRLLRGEFSGGEERKSLRRGRRERHKRRGGVKGIVSECSYTRARIQTRVSIFASAISAQPAGLDRVPRPLFYARFVLIRSLFLLTGETRRVTRLHASSSLKRARSCFPSNNRRRLYPIFLPHTHIRHIRSRLSN